MHLINKWKLIAHDSWHLVHGIWKIICSTNKQFHYLNENKKTIFIYLTEKSVLRFLCCVSALHQKNMDFSFIFNQLSKGLKSTKWIGYLNYVSVSSNLFQTNKTLGSVNKVSLRSAARLIRQNSNLLVFVTLNKVWNY